MHEELLTTSHRPFPLPNLPWVMTQRWDNVLFLHWPVPAEALINKIPDSLELDLYNGTAWIGIVPFHVKGMRLRAMPPVPMLSSFLELNVRTYVKYKSRTGVYFFSMDADSRLAVMGAKATYNLPYMNAKMSIGREDGLVKFFSKRQQEGQPDESFDCHYKPVSSIYFSGEGSLDEWLTERYCLWTENGKKLIRTDIHHKKWRLQKAEAHIRDNTMARFLPPSILKTEPLIHYSLTQQALFWPPIAED
ncbi:YqjF family protein [Bacillus sp. T33-2]|uniref:YqjF family protein n=1 Tax=Bacillus sp. T33-2 TaxID=2054168 RepID=UPI000C7766AA|nr:DUF2071 domain-containing protein [Bacillus sp. T33-2]PLR95317.1 DUF2071 domain-containing protein [Bacillus sp. T33-2]